MPQNPLDAILAKYGLGQTPQPSSSPLDDILKRHGVGQPQPEPKHGFLEMLPDILQDPLKPFVDPFQKAWDWASHTELLGKYPGAIARIAAAPAISELERITAPGMTWMDRITPGKRPDIGLSDLITGNTRPQGFDAGPIIGDIANQTFSPINVGMAAATGGESLLANAGMKGGAAAFNALQRIASVPMIAEGWQQIGEQDNLMGKGFGALEMLGGVVGLKAPAAKVRPPGKPPTPEIIPKPRITAEDFVRLQKEGKLAKNPAAGTMINPTTGRPMQPASNLEGPLRGPDTPWPDPFEGMPHGEFMDIMRKPPVEFTRAEDVLPPLARPQIPEEPQFSKVLGFDKDFRRNQFADELSTLEEQIMQAQTAGDNKKVTLLQDLYQRKYDSYSRFLDQSGLPQEPQFMAAKEGGGVKIGADIGSLSKVLGSSLYQGDIAHIATKELVQNSMDAVRGLGPEGHIQVKLGRKIEAGDYDYSTATKATEDIPAHIEVSDNGPGLTKAELETVFTDLGASGKRSDASAIGGFGLAKAAPLLGGKRVKVTTVALEELRPGTKVKMMHTFEGTPDELIAGVPIESKLATGMPTGTTVRTYLPDNSDTYSAQQFIESLAENSPFAEAKITVDKGYGPTTVKEPGAKNLADFDITSVTTPGADLDIMVPKGTPYGENYVRLQLLNQGMWQKGYIGDYTRYPGIPEKILVNVKSKVPEGHADYPFTANRETLRGSALDELQKHIQDTIIRPSIGRRVQQLKDVYEGMVEIPTVVSKGRPFQKDFTTKPVSLADFLKYKKRGGTLTKEQFLAQNPPAPVNPKIPFTVYDVGRRFTPDEMQAFVNNPTVVKLSQQISDVLHDTLAVTPWATENLEKIGLIFDERVHGIHIPSPGTQNSAILLNPFEAMLSNKPENAAASIAHTIYHELAHIGNVPHAEDFTSRLANLYTELTARKDLEFQGRFFHAITDRTGTRYSPEISNILQQYKTARGRPATFEDPLIGTGISSRNKGPGGTGKVSGGSGPSGEAVTKLIAAIKEAKPIRAEQELMYSAEKGERIKQALKTKMVSEATFRKGKRALAGEYEKVDYTPIKLDQKDVDGLYKTIGDSSLSPWEKYRAGDGMAKILGEMGSLVPQDNELRLLDKVFGAGFSRSLNDAGFIKNPFAGKKRIKLVHELVNAPRAIMASNDLSAPLRQGIGLITRKEWWTSLDDMVRAWGSDKFYKATMEAIEDAPEFSISQFAGLQITDLATMAKREEAFMSRIAEKVPGVVRSERAYMAFLNKLRFDTFKTLLKEAENEGLRPLENTHILEEIATYVNNATGRGSLGKWENSAVNLNNIFFSPRLIASRVNMLNPTTYIKASPFIRRQYLRSMVGVAGAGATVLTLAKMAGADMETNPSSADFGKAKIGNVRLDPFGGFQQYVVAAHRLITGEMKSTTTQREFQLGEGYGTPTRKDIAWRFLESKFNPTVSFVTTLMQNKDFNGLPIEVRKEIGSRFVPIILQDIYELAKEDPKLLNPKLLLTIPAMLGMGVQSYEPRTSGTSIMFGDVDERPNPNVKY